MRLAPVVLALAALAGSAAAQPATPSPRALQLAHQIYEALGGQAQMTAMADRMTGPLMAQLPPPAPGGTDMRADAAAFVHGEIAKFMPQIAAGSERVYAETFTEPELTDILAFYRSPTGRTFASRLPEIGARTAVIIAPVLKQMQADILNHFCDLRGCSPEQRAQIAKLTG